MKKIDEAAFITSQEVKKLLDYVDQLKEKYPNEIYGDIIRLLGFHMMVRFEYYKEAETRLLKLDDEQVEAAIPVELKTKPKKRKKGRK